MMHIIMLVQIKLIFSPDLKIESDTASTRITVMTAGSIISCKIQSQSDSLTVCFAYSHNFATSSGNILGILPLLIHTPICKRMDYVIPGN